ncbi:MAG: DUF3568 family protein [Desulfobacterales bacterium]
MYGNKNIRYGAMFVCLLFFVLAGCVAVVAGGAAGGATYVFTKGWVARDYNVGIDRAYTAGLEAAKNLGMSVVEKSKKIASAEIKIEKGGKDYWIKMEETSKKRTTISVRAGIMGDKEASQKIHEEINKMILG